MVDAMRQEAAAEVGVVAQLGIVMYVLMYI